MCGIFGYVGTHSDAPQQTIQGLKKLEYRGYDSWGVAWLDQDNLKVIKKIGRIGQATLPPIHSNLAIGHTRWATHGGVTEKNAHPHVDPENNIAVVHNGIVENYDELKSGLKEYPFISQTDSEVITALVTREIGHKSLADAVVAVAKQLKGLNAFAVAYAPTNQIVATRNGSPLVIGKGTQGYYLASDTTALAGIVDEVIFLEDQEVLTLGLNSISLTFRLGEPRAIKWQRFQMSANAIEKSGYDFFMLKEIHEQPKVLLNVLTNIKKVGRLKNKLLGKKIVLVGCGTAYHACLSATYYFATSGIWAQAFSGSEFRKWRGFIDTSTHVVFVSQSGETIDIVEHAEWLLKHNQPFTAIINRPNSTLSRLASQTIYLHAGVEICVLATKSFTAQLAVLLLLAAKHDTQTIVRHNILQAAEASSVVIEHSYVSQYIVPVVEKLTKHKHLFIIGKNEGYPIALEAALKIKESSYIHAEGFAAGELKHGVLALIEPGTPVFVVVSSAKVNDSIYSSAQEVKARGGYIIGVGPDRLNNELFDWYLPTSSASAVEITQSVVFQLIAYYLAMHLHRDPDKPRNLAKSVTVK